MKRYSMMLAVLLCAAPALAQDMPKYQTYMSRFEEARARWGDRYPAVVLEDRSDVRIILREWFEKFSQETAFAVFDPARADEALEHVITIPPGSKIKSVRTWSYRAGDDKPVFSKPSDVHVSRTIGSWKEARVAVPGMAGPGVCGIQVNYERDGFGATGDSFVRDFPVLKASFRVVVPSVSSFEAPEMIAQFDKYLVFIKRGNPEEKEPVVGPDGLEWSFRFTDVPARLKDPLMAARDQPQAAVYMRQRFARWKNIVSGFTDGMDDMKTPPEMLAAVKAACGDATGRDAVDAVAAWIDDPGNFRLVTGTRSFGFSADLKEIAAKKEGSSYAKTLLAHLLLSDLGVTNYMALAASRYRSEMDWEMCNPFDLDAALIYLPDEPPGRELWDVADLSTPIGLPGPDLHGSLLLLIPDEKNPIMLHDVTPGAVRESRETRLSLDAGGEVTGGMTWTFASWPSLRGLDPWDPAADLEEPLDRASAGRAKIEKANWTVPEGPRHRLDPDREAVLTGDVSFEAGPHGESGWELKPMFWAPPWRLPNRVDPKRTTKVVLDRAIDVRDRTLVLSPGFGPESLPEETHVVNHAGSLDCSWQIAGDTLIVHRHLSLKSGVLPAEDAGDLDRVLAAWQGIVDQGVVMKPVEGGTAEK